jgi:hypothetical protein
VGKTNETRSSEKGERIKEAAKGEGKFKRRRQSVIPEAYTLTTTPRREFQLSDGDQIYIIFA